KIDNVAFVVGDVLTAQMEEVEVTQPFRHTSRRIRVPMVLLVEATDEQAADDLLKLMPRLGALAANRPLTAEKHQVKGQTVYALPIDPTYATHYSKAGKVIVIGPYAEPVAEALAAGKAKKGLLADESLAERLKAAEGKQVSVTLVKPVAGLAMLSFGVY